MPVPEIWHCFFYFKPLGKSVISKDENCNESHNNDSNLQESSASTPKPMKQQSGHSNLHVIAKVMCRLPFACPKSKPGLCLSREAGEIEMKEVSVVVSHTHSALFHSSGLTHYTLTRL